MIKRHRLEITCLLAVVGGLATSYCNGTHVGEDLYTGPACSAKEHFIVVGDIVNIAAKKAGGPGQ